MALKIACQMDPIAAIDIRGDSTFAMLLEAQRRGAELFYRGLHVKNLLWIETVERMLLVGLGGAAQRQDCSNLQRAHLRARSDRQPCL